MQVNILIHINRYQTITTEWRVQHGIHVIKFPPSILIFREFKSDLKNQRSNLRQLNFGNNDKSNQRRIEHLQ